ncbi:MAG: hypothetical protein FVQ84_08315 [Planctomycetes bacterium]|nr:hypothetical protein [Planctomycetota bacterium]
MRKRLLSYDTETTGLYTWRGHKIFSYSVCNPVGKSTVHRLDGPWERERHNIKYLENIWSDKSLAKIMHNAKFDINMTENCLGRDLSDHKFHDTWLQACILQNHHPSNDLKSLGYELAGISVEDEDAVKPFLSYPRGYQDCPEYLMDRYQHIDAERAMLLHLFFHPKILENKNFVEIYKMERDLVLATMRMERRGIMLNKSVSVKMALEIQIDCNKLKLDFEAATGQRGIITSPKKLSWYLYKKMNYPSLKKTKEGDSVDKNTLMQLQEIVNDPCIEMILKHRSWQHGISMLNSYLELADGQGIIHPNIKTCGPDTAREACSKPNLQNVTKAGVLLNPYAISARKAFRPRPGYVNFHLDYSGIEMRILVHYSGEKYLINIIRNKGDVHVPATEIFYCDRMPWGSDFQTLRGAAKNANFAIPYGSGAPKLAKILNITLEQAHQRYTIYKCKFLRLCGLIDTIGREVGEQGYVLTIFGRRLYVAKPHAGVNYKVQGSAAGIIKRAQVRVARFLQETTGDEVQILLPIHDEIIIECSRKRLRDFYEILPKIISLMVDFPQLSVPLEVDIKVTTTNWDDKKKINKTWR